MLETLKEIFGIGPQADYKDIMQRGAQIVDVRTIAEFKGGHIQNSLNMPLNNLSNCCTSLKKDKPVITCCASGMRSAQAKSMLQEMGFKEVYNGGGWVGLKNKI